MASAILRGKLTLEEFHRRYDGEKPHWEYWFGDAVQKPMPTLLHSLMQTVLILLFHKRGWLALPEATLKLIREAEPVPDLIADPNVSVMAAAGSYPTRPFALAVEIRSPDQSVPFLMDKAWHYRSWGVHAAWVVDPEARTAWMISDKFSEGVWLRPDEALTVDDVEISLTELFGELDHLLAQNLHG
jgi:Uma2 family endonuclease